MDTTDPPGGEKPVVDYLKQLLEAEGIPVQMLAMPDRPTGPIWWPASRAAASTGRCC